MKELQFRILNGWSLSRVLFLGIGFTVIMSSIQDQMVTGIAFGSYFMLMGLLGLGCAGGNCYVKESDAGLAEKEVVEEYWEVEEEIDPVKPQITADGLG